MIIPTAYVALPMAVAAVIVGLFIVGSAWNYFVAPRLMRRIVGTEAWALIDDDLRRATIRAVQMRFGLFRA